MSLRRWPDVLTSFSHFRGCVIIPQWLSSSVWRQLGGIAAAIRSSAAAELYTYLDATGEWQSTCQEIPVRVRERRPPVEDHRPGGGGSHPGGECRFLWDWEVDAAREHCRYAAVGWGGRGAGCSLAGHCGFTSPTSSAGTSRGPAGSVRSGPDESGRTTTTDPTSFACW
jgi:hypothetical protein